MVELREIRTEDYDFLWEMLYQAIYSPDQELPKSVIYQPTLATYAAGFGQEADYGCVLVADKTLVGAAWTRLLKGENKGYGYVDDSTPELAMAVKKDYRGRGYGQMLVERISDRLREQGYHQVSLSVDKQNRAARLYQRLGFQIASETQTTYTMIKKLQN